MNAAAAIGWPAGKTPVPAAGLHVKEFARGLNHPRWIYVLPNGDVLVAETGVPAERDNGRSVRGWLMRRTMNKAGANVESANKIVLLRDTDGDGVADYRSTLLSELNSPFGIALIGNQLYVANANALVRFPYVSGDTTIASSATEVTPLPAGSINRHWTRSLVVSADGALAYVAVGSASDHGERGMEHENDRAAIWEVDLSSGFHRIYASGLRNPVGMAWDERGALWVVVSERDELGGDVPPDYLTKVIQRGFYGWPYSYWGGNVDSRVKQSRPDLVAESIAPDYSLGAHVTPLGLAYVQRSALSPHFGAGVFIGQHGSWNRNPRSGYKVVFVRFRRGMPQGAPVEVLGGFLDHKGNAYGRPAGVAVDLTGALLVADDVGNTVWRVTAER